MMDESERIWRMIRFAPLPVMRLLRAGSRVAWRMADVEATPRT
jgi:hypothetical protein